MNDPPFNISFNYPNGLPEFLQPNEEYTIQIQLIAIGASIDSDGSFFAIMATRKGKFLPC